MARAIDYGNLSMLPIRPSIPQTGLVSYGDLDAVTCAFGSKICAWYENDGSGGFARHVVGTNQEACDIHVADLDGDGGNDFLVAGRKSDNVVVYLNPKQKR